MIFPVVLAFVVGAGGTLLILTVLNREQSLTARRLRAHGAGLVEETDRSSNQTRSRRRRPARGLWRALTRPQRERQITVQIVDALTVISGSLKAGHSFLQAMELASREIQPPLGEEFARALHEMSLGVSVEESLEEMVDRVDQQDLALIVTAVLVQRQVGGNLAEVLDNLAYTIRERIRIRGEIRTLTAQGRISGLIVGFLPLALGLVVSVINPSYMSVLFSHPIGIMLLVVGVCGQLIGYVLIRRIIRIEV